MVNLAKYLSGYVDLGVLGKRDIYVFKNDKREKNQPHYRVYIKENGKNGKWIEVGALWLKERKESGDLE